jgi:hypothetical protein
MGMQDLHDSYFLQINVRQPLPDSIDRKMRHLELLTLKRNGVKAQLFVKILMVYIAFGWICTEVFYYGIWCRPFMDYFAVKEDNNRGFIYFTRNAGRPLRSLADS